MKPAFHIGWLVIFVFLHSGCNYGMPPPRMDVYLGKQAMAAKGAIPSQGPLDVGLLVINDTTAPEAAPPFSKGALTFLTDRVGKKLKKSFPISAVKVLAPDGVGPADARGVVLERARQQNVSYVVFTIFSSSEVEVPTYLAFGAAGPDQEVGSGSGMLGYRAENYALVEIALLQVQSGKVLVEADGNAWAYLLRLNVPVESNNYPVVRRGQLIAPIFPKEENAHDTLRVVSGEDALDQALMHLGDTWK